MSLEIQQDKKLHKKILDTLWWLIIVLHNLILYKAGVC